MRFFLDTEFIENGQTIDLISIGIVAEDGRTYYACNDECDLSRANDWVVYNVFPSLPSKYPGVNPGNPDVSPKVKDEILTWKTRDRIAIEVLEFCDPSKYGKPEFWGEWCSYDWVAFCWLFGDMAKLPDEFPMRCNDIVQYAEHLGLDSDALPSTLETEGNHHALLGAKTVKQRFHWLVEKQIDQTIPGERSQ